MAPMGTDDLNRKNGENGKRKGIRFGVADADGRASVGASWLATSARRRVRGFDHFLSSQECRRLFSLTDNWQRSCLRP